MTEGGPLSQPSSNMRLRFLRILYMCFGLSMQPPQCHKAAHLVITEPIGCKQLHAESPGAGPLQTVMKDHRLVHDVHIVSVLFSTSEKCGIVPRPFSAVNQDQSPQAVGKLAPHFLRAAPSRQTWGVTTFIRPQMKPQAPRIVGSQATRSLTFNISPSEPSAAPPRPC
jgi:hypothetical protein